MASMKNHCNYCYREVGRENLKACGVCRMVRYCSKDCQRAAWPTHKRCCSSRLRDSLAEDPSQAAKNARLSKWLTFWRNSLHTWSVWALNIENHPRDRFSTHCFVIWIEERRNRPGSEPGLYFRLSKGEVLPRGEVVRLLQAINAPEIDIEAWKEDLRGDDTVQIIVIAETLVRMQWFSLRDAESRWKRGDEDGVGHMLTKDWVKKLGGIIESGDRTQKYLEEVVIDAVSASTMGVLSKNI